MKLYTTLFFALLTSFCWANNDSDLTNFCHPSQTLECGEIYHGSTTHEDNDIAHYNGCRSESFNGNDKVFKFVKHDNRGRLTVNLFNNKGLDLFLLDRCDRSQVNCINYDLIDSNTPYAGIHKNNLSAGTYYIAVDAMNHNVYGDFTLSATCGYLDCHAAEKVNCKQTVHASTHNGKNDISAIKCDGNLWGGYMGKEKLYYFELTREQQVTINLSNISHGENLDLFLLRECDEYTTIACSQKSNNNNENITKTLSAGKYYVLIDGVNDSNGNFSLTVDWNCCEEEYDNHCNDITATPLGTNNSLKYRFEVPNHSLYLGATWIVKGGIYGNAGREIGSGFSTEWTFPSAGTYTICLKYPLPHSHNCYAYCCKTIVVEEAGCEDEWNYFCNYINYHFTGSGNTLSYQLSNTSNNTALSWTINGAPITGSGNTITYTFPAPGEYTVCFKYRKHDGCYAYCCKKIVIPPHCEDEYDYFCNYINYHFTGSGTTLSYQLSNTSNNTALSWTINGAPITGSGNIITYTFPAPGEYTVCFKYRKHDGCYAYCCKKIVIPPHCEDEYDYFCNYINYHFTGSGTTLSYQLSNTSNNTALSWTINGAPITGSGNTITYTFPTPGEYTVCFKYRKHDGCYAYCCKKIVIPPHCEEERDFYCDKITYSFAGTNSALTYDFVNTSQVTDGTWILSGGTLGGEITIGSGNRLSYTFLAPGTYTICYRYKKHDGCYYYCCKKICVEYPFDCRLIRKQFNYQNGKYNLSLDGISAENIINWKNEGTGESLGNGTTLTINNPFQCIVISVFYKDPVSGCHKVCCIQLCRVCYGEKDPDCNAISWYAQGNDFNYTFNVPNTTDYTNGMWTISGARYGRDVMSGGSGNTLNWTFPAAGKYTVCFTYTNFDGSKFSCCKTIWIQQPGECDWIISEYDEFSQKYTLSITNAEQVQWRNEGNNQIIGSGNVIQINNPFTCQFISAVFFDTNSGCYRTCRIEICPYENCFGFDPYFSNPWLGALQQNLAASCSENPNVKIETARYNGKCVVIVPPVDYTCGGIGNGKGFVFDAAGNLIFSYGGTNADFNLNLLANMRNKTLLWSCSGNSNNADQGDDLENRTIEAAVVSDATLGNYPNPFSTETLITFTLPAATRAMVRIVDALGQTVFELEEAFTKGENEVFFSKDNALPSGIYFLQLESENINLVHTMVVENK